MRHVPHFFRLSLGLLALSGLGCSSSSTTTNTILRPELVGVSPDDFLADVACGTGPGQAQSYVATLFDVTPTEDGSVPVPGFQLPSSPPTTCRAPVTFSFVVTSHRYIAQVDVYDQPAAGSSLVGPDAGAADAGEAGAGGASASSSSAGEGASPISATALGSRLMQDANGARVTPRWTRTCGGYAPARVDGGLNTYGGAGSVSEGNDQPVPAEAGDAGQAGQTGQSASDNPLVGVLTYDDLTVSVHDCRDGLHTIAN